MITFADAKVAFVQALYQLLSNSDEQEWFNAREIAAAARIDVKGAFVSRVISVSEEEDDVFNLSHNDGETYYSLGREGFALIDAAAVGNDQAWLAPASDRLVPLNHNAPEEEEISNELEKLEEAIRGENAGFEQSPEMRNVAVAEISALRRLWQASGIRIEAFKLQAQRSLSWISEKASAAAIAEICKHVLKLILGW